jgi:hypothetical protein
MSEVGVRRPIVLVVEADDEERDRLGSALERGGFEVIQCPGPVAPEYVCVGSLDGRCPLVSVADAIVLDLWLESDTVMVGTSAHELLDLYLASAKPVVTLGSVVEPDHRFEDGRVTRLSRMPEPDEVVRAVRTATRAPV